MAPTPITLSFSSDSRACGTRSCCRTNRSLEACIYSLLGPRKLRQVPVTRTPALVEVDEDDPVLRVRRLRIQLRQQHVVRVLFLPRAPIRPCDLLPGGSGRP